MEENGKSGNIRIDQAEHEATGRDLIFDEILTNLKAINENLSRIDENITSIYNGLLR